jgi:hypothetical protein
MNSIFETLKELSDNQHNHSKDNQTTKRKDPSYIYLDKNNQIKEIPLSKLDSAASALTNRTMNYKNPAKIIHVSIFGKY